MDFDLNDPSEQSAVQREAIAAGMQLLQDQGHARARFTMACGTGKTFTQLKLAEALLQAWGDGPRRIVVLVPTLALVRQSRDEWAAAQDQGDAYASLCVCSDPSLKTDVLQDQGEDHVELSAEELAELGVEPHANALSDVKRINGWLDARERDFGPRAVSVIFTTYQSVQVVAMAMDTRQPGDRAIHIGIFDEAHKTAGAAGKPFAYALNDANLAIDKRLFFTATERIAAPGKSARSDELEEDGESQVISMDDEAVYGPRAYSLSFSQAAARGIIVPYEIIISVVGDPTIKGQKLAQRSVRSESGDRHNAIDIANMTALQRVMDKFKLNKAITFHRTVARAKDFAEMRHTVEGARMDGSNGFNRLHVSGRQTPVQRHAQMLQYAQGEGRQVITNARCLTEGINVPATDIVGFMDSRGSTVDIVQAAGRTMRRAPGKTKGYIFLPVHDIEQDFGRVRDVLAALAENDEMLLAEMRRVALDGGVGHGSGVRLGALPIQILTDAQGGEVRAEQLAKAIKVKLVQAARRVVDYFEVAVGALQVYKAENGHVDVPVGYTTKEGLKLGQWITAQRSRARLIEYPVERRVRLDALGFDWDPISSSWARMLKALEDFKSEYGHCNVPLRYVRADGVKLGVWLRTQRDLVNKGLIGTDRQAKLSDLGVVWNTLDDSWNRYHTALKKFKKNFGHANPHANFVTESGIRLGAWLANQRSAERTGRLPASRKKELTEIGIFWSVLDENWEEHFSALQEFKNEFGHCRVPNKFLSKDGLRLGQWVRVQRESYSAKSRVELHDSRVERLEAIGFSWGVREEIWESFFDELKKFKAAHGHCNVPQKYKTVEGLTLGAWLSNQRAYAKGEEYAEGKKRSLSEGRRVRLENLGVVWDVKEAVWAQHFAALQCFKAANGHCNVPHEYVSDNGLKLGAWFVEQHKRAKRPGYPATRRESLESLEIYLPSAAREAEPREAIRRAPGAQGPVEDRGSCH